MLIFYLLHVAQAVLAGSVCDYVVRAANIDTYTHKPVTLW